MSTVENRGPRRQPHTPVLSSPASSIQKDTPLQSTVESSPLSDFVGTPCSEESPLSAPDQWEVRLAEKMEQSRSHMTQNRVQLERSWALVETESCDVVGLLNSLGPREKLVSSSLNALLASFSWPDGTRVLHSRHLEEGRGVKLDASLPRRTILPCTRNEHWGLFEIENTGFEVTINVYNFATSRTDLFSSVVEDIRRSIDRTEEIPDLLGQLQHNNESATKVLNKVPSQPEFELPVPADLP